jgi:hypothetical protein
MSDETPRNRNQANLGGCQIACVPVSNALC